MIYNDKALPSCRRASAYLPGFYSEEEGEKREPHEGIFELEKLWGKKRNAQTERVEKVIKRITARQESRLSSGQPNLTDRADS